MTVTEALLKTVSMLPKPRQQEVLDFAEFLGEKENLKADRRSMQGILADKNITFSPDDLRRERNEMWRGYTADTETENVR